MLKELLATDNKLIDARDNDGSTPLHRSTWKGQQGVVAVLLEAGGARPERALGSDTAACSGPRQSGCDCSIADRP
jgi:ankyrin repeat protein